MEVGLYGNTHGQSYRDDVNMFLHHTPVEEMDPIRVALTAERAGIHSIWYPDHVCMPYDFRELPHRQRVRPTRLPAPP